MRVIMFQHRFAILVSYGAKTQTIRAVARCKPGDALSLREWYGAPYRSRHEILREATCTAVIPVRVSEDGVAIGGRWVDRDAFANADGFLSWQDMRDWFASVHGLPFDGVCIQWSNAAGQARAVASRPEPACSPSSSWVRT
jgi:hypothetical protein